MAAGYSGNGNVSATWVGAQATTAYISPTPPTDSAAGNLRNDLQNCNARLRSAIGRASAIADSYFGAGPEQGIKGGAGRDPQTGALYGLMAEARDFDALLDALSTQLDRLSCI